MVQVSYRKLLLAEAVEDWGGSIKSPNQGSSGLGKEGQEGAVRYRNKHYCSVNTSKCSVGLEKRKVVF